MKSFRFAVLFSVSAACAGCGHDDGRVEVYPVRGKVLVSGRPAQDAQVVFYPVSTESNSTLPTPEGTTDANGEFRLRSYDPNDGAPAGEYNVTVVWLAPPPPDATGIFDQKDRLRGRYADPQRSGLTATITEGGGELPPFDLQ